VICIVWTLFVSVLFSLPTYFPVTAENMNYASVITVGVIALSLYVSPFPVSSGTLITIFCCLKGLVSFWVRYSFPTLEGYVAYQLTADTAQGDTTKALFRTPTVTEIREMSKKATPKRMTQMPLGSRYLCVVTTLSRHHLRCGKDVRPTWMRPALTPRISRFTYAHITAHDEYMPYNALNTTVTGFIGPEYILLRLFPTSLGSRLQHDPR
jgi:hypothetical protein